MGRFIGGGAGTVPQQRPRRGLFAMEIPRLFASRNGTVNSRPCFAYGRNLSDSCIGKACGMLRGLLLCRFESLREGAPPLGENGQRCCGLKAPMVLIRSSKSSRETSVCPLIFDR